MAEAPAVVVVGRGVPGPGRRRRARLAARRRGLVRGAGAGPARAARSGRSSAPTSWPPSSRELAPAPRRGRRRRRGPRCRAGRSSSTSRRRRAASSTRRRSPTRSSPTALPAGVAGRARPGCSAPVAAELPRRVGGRPAAPDALVAPRLAGPAAGARGRRAGPHLPPGPSPIVAPRRPRRRGPRRRGPGTTDAVALAVLMHPGATLLFTDGARRRHGLRGWADGGDLGRRATGTIPIEQYVDPVGAGRHVPRRRLRGLGRPGITARPGSARTRTCGSARRRLADPRGPGRVRRPGPRDAVSGGCTAATDPG